jgi:hypothetical protein
MTTPHPKALSSHVKTAASVRNWECKMKIKMKKTSSSQRSQESEDRKVCRSPRDSLRRSDKSKITWR